jgi:hypothetical protein
VCDVLTSKRRNKERWSAAFSRWFDAVLLTKVWCDALAIEHSRKDWMKVHCSFVRKAVNDVFVCPDPLVMLSRPLVYAWFSSTDSRLVYFGETERGFSVRIREELEHCVVHKVRGICNVEKAKGRCDEKLASMVADHGLQKMLIVPYVFCDEWELKVCEKQLYREHQSMLNKENYWLWRLNAVSLVAQPYRWAQKKKTRHRPNKGQRKRRKLMMVDHRVPGRIVTVSTLPFFVEYMVIHAELGLQRYRDLGLLLSTCISAGHCQQLFMRYFPGQKDATAIPFLRTLTVGKSLCKIVQPTGIDSIFTLREAIKILRADTRTLPSDIMVVKLRLPKKRSDLPIYQTVMRLATGKTSSASWTRLYLLGRNELLQAWCMAFYLPTDTLRELAVTKLSDVCAKKLGFVPPVEIKGVMNFSHRLDIKGMLYELQRDMRSQMLLPRELAVNLTSIIAASFKGDVKLGWRVQNVRERCRKHEEGSIVQCVCEQVKERLRELGCDFVVAKGHVCMLMKHLMGRLECFRSISAKTVPLPSTCRDKAEAVMMMSKVVNAFSPLLNSTGAAVKRLKGIAARNIKWKAQYASRGLQVDDDKIALLLWAFDGCIRYTLDKNPGEMCFECPVLYFADYE